jgi:outer membrane protein TolC
MDTVDEDRRIRFRRTSRDADSDAGRELEDSVRRAIKEEYPNREKLTLADALAIATRFSREFSDQRDDNLSAGLSLIGARHIFDPRLVGALSYLNAWAKDTGVFHAESVSHTASGSLGLEYLSQYGTSVRTSVGTDHTHHLLGPAKDSNASRASLTVEQPLMRGGGRLVNREPLTRAERSIIYRLRSFELFRQDFSIQITRLYYDLVRQKQVIRNTQRRYERADFLYKRAQELFKIGRVPEIDVFQAEQERLQVKNNLRDTRESLRNQLLRFKIVLGVPDDVEMDVKEGELPKYRKVDITEAQAVQTALHNRLDLATAKDQIEDAKRGVRIARNSLLPSLALFGSAGTSAGAGSAFREQVFRNFNASGGIRLSIPFDRVNEQIAARRADLNLDSVKRGYTLFRANVMSSVRSVLRNIRRIEDSIQIQKKILVAAEKRVSVAEIRFRQGTRPSRDVVEAQEDLLNAQNTYLQFIVDYEISTLELARAIGILRIDTKGVPIEPEPKEKKTRPSGKKQPEKPAPDEAGDAPEGGAE